MNPNDGNILQLEELLRQPVRHREHYLCYPLLPVGGKMFLSAPAKSFKSMLTMDMLLSLASGTQVWGLYPVPRPCRILLMEQEIGWERMAERFKLMVGLGPAPQDLWIVSKNLEARLDSRKGLDYLKTCVDLVEPDILVLDPLRKFHTLDEDSSTDMGLVMRNLSQVQQDTGVTAIIVHHHGKPSEHKPSGSPVSMRGSSVLFDEGDTYVTVSRPDMQAPRVKLYFTLRSAEDPLPLWMLLTKRGEQLMWEHQQPRRLPK